MNYRPGIFRLILNDNLIYHFNPFGGMHDEELEEIFVPRIFTPEIIEKIQGEKTGIIELVGPKGRGKTTHLRYLHELFPSYPIFYPEQRSDYAEISAHPSEVLFLDSIHRLRLTQRIQLFRKKKLLILTTHWKRWGEYFIAGKSYVSYSFRGIDQQVLTKLLQKRIALATQEESDKIHLNPGYVQALIARHGDNYRGILNQLYDIFSQDKLHDQKL